MNAIPGEPIIHADEIVGCKTHRRYQVKRKPRVPCVVCWTMWIAQHTGKLVATTSALAFARKLLAGFDIQGVES